MTETFRARLLIVDDEAAHMRALCDTLEEQGFEVHGCVDAHAALSALGHSRFELLFTDLMMPAMNGIELLRRALAIDPMLVGIIMTGEGTIGTAVEAMQSGALDYVLKPFKLSAALPVLNRALAMRQLRVENAALEKRVREHAAELEAANRELDAFTRSASHDLRSPLNAVLGLATLLQHSIGAQIPDAQRRWLVQIEHAARRMAELTDALMRLSRAGRQALVLQPVDARALVQSVVDELQQAEPERRMQVHLGDLPQIHADASLLKQAFFNLLSNAFKYTRGVAVAQIDVRFEQLGDERVFSVHDNGAGFEMAKAERLFHPFERLHRDDEFEGSGIGLSIVQRIVQRHGGRVWAEAEPGAGARFYFSL